MTKVPWKTPSMASPRPPGLAWPLQSLPWLSPRSWRCPWAKNDPWSGHCENCPSFRSNKNDEQRLGSTENDVEILVSKWNFTLKRSLFFLIPPFKEKQGAGLGWIIPHVKKRWIFGGSLRLERRCLDQPPAVPAATEKHRDVTNNESPQVDFNSLDVVSGNGFLQCFFTMLLCGERCGFQCILEKRCWTKCWPTCFFSLSVLLESELVCEVWDDYLNKQAAFWCGIRYLNLTGSFFGLQVEIRMLIHYESGHVFWVLIGQWVS